MCWCSVQMCRTAAALLTSTDSSQSGEQDLLSWCELFTLHFGIFPNCDHIEYEITMVSEDDLVVM